MTTREENLKKINSELEIMSDEELDQVAGGSCYETADDSRFLNVLLKGTKYHQCDRYGATRIFFNLGSGAIDDVVKAWDSLGIKVNVRAGVLGQNIYKLNGNIISQSEAWAHAEKLVGKHLTEKDWNW